MIETRKRIAFCYCSVSFLVLTGCATSSNNQQFTMTFMPPAPKQAVASASVENLQVRQPVTVAESPVFVKASVQLPPKPSQTDMRLRRADERFAAGRRAYQDGDLFTARNEFDKAIDLLLTTPESADRYKVEQKLEELVAAIHKYDVNGLAPGICPVRRLTIRLRSRTFSR